LILSRPSGKSRAKWTEGQQLENFAHLLDVSGIFGGSLAGCRQGRAENPADKVQPAPTVQGHPTGDGDQVRDPELEEIFELAEAPSR
jgi:hypothetical protein